MLLIEPPLRQRQRLLDIPRQPLTDVAPWIGPADRTDETGLLTEMACQTSRTTEHLFKSPQVRYPMQTNRFDHPILRLPVLPREHMLNISLGTGSRNARTDSR
jgi:hypothetical protein